MNTEHTTPRQKVFVVGHMNPDTDSVCSAIAYAELKKRTEGESFVPCRAGELSRETEWVLRRFGLSVPRLLEDVSPQVRDAEIRRISGISGELTVKEAWEIMRDSDISTLPVINPDGTLSGIITLKDLAVSQMDSLDTHALASARTPYRNIAKTLCGRMLVGNESDVMDRGFILIGAGNPEAIREKTRPGDLLIVSNREESQRAAIEAGASCLLVCLAAEPCESVLRLAQNHGCAVMSTPFDTYKAAYLINQSVPVEHYRVGNVQSFRLDTPLEDVVRVMGKTRFVYFPVMDENGAYYGVISRRNLLNRNRKQLILVDHNEKSQCVPGWEEADILEIVDHHRVGGMQTLRPIFFRNQPVGCTSTIIRQMYAEQGLVPSSDIAGVMCCAILSDTLLFRSPTCTEADREAAEYLAKLAGVELHALGETMFAAGENLDGKSGDELLRQDYKIFSGSGKRFGISQSMFFSASARETAIALAGTVMEERRRADGIDYLYYLLTDISAETSLALCAGEGAETLLREAFSLEADAPLQLRGVVSRKKQFVPAILETLRQREEKL